MACPKQKTVKEINDKIRSQKYGFSGRITKIIDGRMMTFYKEWENRFVDFCLYRHLTELAIQKTGAMACRKMFISSKEKF